MAALDYLRGAGLAVELEGERLRVSPADRITADLRQFVREHRAELLAELIAANDAQPACEPPHAPAAPAPIPTQAPTHHAPPEPRKTAWRIAIDGKPICSMVGEPMAYTEALAAARWRWPTADLLES